MAKDPESNLNFDWLSNEKTDDGPDFSSSAGTHEDSAEPQFPGPPADEASTKENDAEQSGTAEDSTAEASAEKLEPAESGEKTSESDETDTASVFDDFKTMPEPEKNVSDGTTLVMKDGPTVDGFTPEGEEFAQPEEPVERDLDEIETTAPEAFVAHADEQTDDQESPGDFASDESFDVDSSTTEVADEDTTESADAEEAPADEEVSDSEDTIRMSVGDNQVTTDVKGDDEDTTVVLTPPVTPQPTAEEQQPQAAVAQSAESAKPAVAAEPVRKSNLPFILLVSYASAVTLALIFLLTRDNTKPHHLESLPDVVPEKENKLSYVPVHARLAPGHTLRIGDKQRFGNLEVEVLRITREPIEFVHYTGNASRTREPSEPVYKLWLKFTNVSTDQTFQPLGRQLVLRWVNANGKERSNFYIAPRNASAGDEPQAQLYHLSSASDWDLKGQHLDKELGPGESMECYLATEEGAKVEGDLAWRVQFRKGLSPSGNGVTTMIEVAFDPNQLAT